MDGCQESGAPTRGARRYLVPAAVLIAGAALAFVLLRTGPSARRKPPARVAKLVEVELIALADLATTVTAMGTVMPARQIALAPRVNGEIVAVSDEFAPGGFFGAGEEMVRIDPTDYELLVRQREAALAQAQSAYELEMGQQTVAEREYELLDEAVSDEDRFLVLRHPQLQSADASVAAARAALEDARLDLARTGVRAPFNAVLGDKRADLGTQVSGASPVGTLIGTDEFWVEASAPVDQLRWIRIPRRGDEKGARVRVYDEAAWGVGQYRTGEVIRLHPGVEEQGRMARLLISVADPLALESERAHLPRMMLSTYVRVEIEGAVLSQVATISRSSLRDGDKVHLLGDDGKLEIRPIEVVFRAADAVYTRGIRTGERLVTTDLSAAVEGMPLRLQDAAAGRSQRAEEGGP